ncbi:oxidoreductase [Chromobacterium alticapitis]|uniref:Oxidoreductase n=1 Tax=Chromobacterium alticapitis TaxID=2073169 RepID=A0A2S5DIS3_9NEIS|nr:oxidoreductase [Chromobacterium alticapitis]POZ62995.1 oxidoreductase [Chromobacterium alticapitis]
MMDRLIGFTLLAVALCLPALAQSSPILLTVSGHISRYTDARLKVYQFSEADLQALPQHSIITQTSWTPKSTFTGPLLRDILQKAGAADGQVKLSALNDYAYTIAAHELIQYGTILARERDGRKMEIADRGPLWLIYPLDDMPARLRGPLQDAKLVWQVNRMDIR